MKNIAIAVLAIFLLLSCEKEEKGSVETDITVSMAANYENDIFYSLENNSVLEVNRTNWDIAFGTYVMSPSILINGGNGVKLFEVSKDTADYYNLLDTSGMGSWTALNNSLETWDIGAFSGNMSGGFNFGWGIYNHSTKNVNGAAVFIIKLADNSLKKIFIRQKNGFQNMVYFLYANIDGSEEKVITLSNNAYADKEYIYYSIMNDAVADREPARENWDLLFTKYFDTQINYIVTGVLSKPGVKVAKITGVSPATADTTDGVFASTVAAIGYDWKQIDMVNNVYTLQDDVSYFVKNSTGSVYQIYFTKFEGASTGMIGFKKVKIK